MKEQVERVRGLLGLVTAVVLLGSAVPAAAFRFPGFAATLNLTPTVVTLDKCGEILQRVMLSMFTRLGLSSADWRTKLDAQVSQPFDWERLRSRDAAIAPLLKKLVAGHELLP